MNTRVAFFWIGNDVSIPNYLVQSIRLVGGPEIEVIQLTDFTTPTIPEVSRVSRHTLSESIMIARLQAYSYLELSSNFTYFCDADSIFINTPHIESNADVLLCPRNDNFKINPHYPEYYPEFDGKMILDVMPYMFGAIALRGTNNIFKGLLRKCLKLPSRFHRWYGDQVALSKAVGAGNFNHLLLNPSIYLNIVSSVPTQDQMRTLINEGIQMLTFKGPAVEKTTSLKNTYEILKLVRGSAR